MNLQWPKRKQPGFGLLLVVVLILPMLSIACAGPTDTYPASATGQTAAADQQAEVGIPSTQDRVGAEEPGASTIRTSETPGSKELPPLEVRLSFEGKQLSVGRDIPLTMGFILMEDVPRPTAGIETSGVVSLILETSELGQTRKWEARDLYILPQDLTQGFPVNEEVITETAFRIGGLGEGLIKAEVLVFAESGELLYGRAAHHYFLVTKGEVLTGTSGFFLLKLEYLDRALKSGTITRGQYDEALDEAITREQYDEALDEAITRGQYDEAMDKVLGAFKSGTITREQYNEALSEILGALKSSTMTWEQYEEARKEILRKALKTRMITQERYDEAPKEVLGAGGVETSQTQEGEPQPDVCGNRTHTEVEGVSVEGKPSTAESSKILPPLEVRLSFEDKQLPVGKDVPLEMGFIFKDDVYRATTLIEASGVVSLTEITNLELDNPPTNEEVTTQTAFRIEGLGEGLIKAEVLVFAESGELLYGRAAHHYFLVANGEVLTGNSSPFLLKRESLDRALKSGTITREQYDEAWEEFLGGGGIETSGSVSKCP